MLLKLLLSKHRCCWNWCCRSCCCRKCRCCWICCCWNCCWNRCWNCCGIAVGRLVESLLDLLSELLLELLKGYVGVVVVVVVVVVVRLLDCYLHSQPLSEMIRQRLQHWMLIDQLTHPFLLFFELTWCWNTFLHVLQLADQIKCHMPLDVKTSFCHHNLDVAFLWVLNLQLSLLPMHLVVQLRRQEAHWYDRFHAFVLCQHCSSWWYFSLTVLPSARETSASAYPSTSPLSRRALKGWVAPLSTRPIFLSFFNLLILKTLRGFSWSWGLSMTPFFSSSSFTHEADDVVDEGEDDIVLSIRLASSNKSVMGAAGLSSTISSAFFFEGLSSPSSLEIFFGVCSLPLGRPQVVAKWSSAPHVQQRRLSSFSWSHWHSLPLRQPPSVRKKRHLFFSPPWRPAGDPSFGPGLSSFCWPSSLFNFGASAACCSFFFVWCPACKKMFRASWHRFVWWNRVDHQNVPHQWKTETQIWYPLQNALHQLAQSPNQNLRVWQSNLHFLSPPLPPQPLPQRWDCRGYRSCLHWWLQGRQDSWSFG